MKYQIGLNFKKENFLTGAAANVKTVYRNYAV